MQEKNKNHNRRMRNLIILFALTAIIISVSTYAWFIGMNTVTVNEFEVKISATESLMLSLDGKSWADTVTITGDNYNDSDEVAEDGDEAVVYKGNTNTWSKGGLLPMSSIGKIDASSSRLKLFEKASVSSSDGGWRLLSTQVGNSANVADGEPYAKEEAGKGFVSFDLFIKNFSGTDYVKNLDILNEEAIYLTTDSEVNVASSGVAGTGIENSVRVAFAQIGRVEAIENDHNVITGITCAGDSVVTGICTRDAQIWEPNDTAHESNALKFYNYSCLKRTDKTTYSSTNEKCGQAIDGIAYPTYAVRQKVEVDQAVDVYDGGEFNSFAGTITNDSTDSDIDKPLYKYDYFTDTKKYLAGMERPEFMMLAPNSITKVRVYVYIEGQDIDNYDWAAIGKAISVQFGLTKQRFTENDFDYQGPDYEPVLGDDVMVPVIYLAGDQVDTVAVDTSPTAKYNDPGIDRIVDNVDGEITGAALDSYDIRVIGTVNIGVPGTYKLTYKATDSSLNVGVKVRTVIVTGP